MNVTAPPAIGTTVVDASTALAPRPAGVGGKDLPSGGEDLPQTSRAVPPISIENAIAQIRAFLDQSKRQLTFEHDESTGRTIIKVIDPQSGQVLRQFPPEELLKLAAMAGAGTFHTLDQMV